MFYVTHIFRCSVPINDLFYIMFTSSFTFLNITFMVSFQEAMVSSFGFRVPYSKAWISGRGRASRRCRTAAASFGVGFPFHSIVDGSSLAQC